MPTKPTVRIRELRNAKGLTAMDLAVATGLGVDTIQNLEHGTQAPKLATARLVAAALGSTLDEVFPPGNGRGALRASRKGKR